RADLAEVVLLLHSLGIRKAAEFDWLDKPDPAAVDRAEKLLRLLGALESSEFEVPSSEFGVASSELAGAAASETTRNAELGTRNSETTRNPERGTRNSDVTSIGRQMLRLPLHPRYSRMLV